MDVQNGHEKHYVRNWKPYMALWQRKGIRQDIRYHNAVSLLEKDGRKGMSAEKANEQIGSVVDSEGKSTKKKVIVISTVVTVCVAAVIVLLLLLGKSPEEFNVVVTPDNVEDAIRKLNESEFVPIGSYEVVMNTDWTFPNGSSASTDAHVENCINNQNTVYFTIALADGDGTDIYTSPYIDVGSYIENIKLDQTLTAGTYDAVLTYHLVDEQHQEMSHVSVSITLNIQK